MKRRTMRYWLLFVVAACGVARAQSTAPTIPVPSTIRAEGVPPIPASVGEALNRYQNIRSASFQDWASDGSGMYIITRFADAPQVHFVEKAGGARTQLTFLKDRVLSVHARPKHDQFLYVADEGGGENYQFFLQDRKTGQARRITDGKSRNMAPKWSPSGSLLAWSSNARNGRDMDIYVAAPTDPHFVRRLKEVSGQWTVSDWSPDETRLAVVEYISINDLRIHLVDVQTGKTETIAGPGPDEPDVKPSHNASPRWSKDGKSLYYITDDEQEFRYLVRWNFNGPLAALTYPDQDIEEFDISDDGIRIAVVVNEGGASLIVHTDYPGTREDLRPQFMQHLAIEDRYHPVFGLACLKGSPGPVFGPNPWRSGVITNLRFQPGTHLVGFSLSGATAPADAYAFIVKGSSLNPTAPTIPARWTTSESAGLDTGAFPQAQTIEFASFDGRKIPAFVYRPTNNKGPDPAPVLIDIHGGPESQFRPAFLGRLNYLVNELGIVLICPNVRGSSGYGKSYLNLDNGKLREDAVKDIGALLDWIGQQKDLDKTRVGVMGGSYGGFMSLAVQTTYNDRIRAGIDIVGISNFVSFLQYTQGYRRDLRRAEYGDERDPAMRNLLERVSPLTNAGKIHTPILIVQGQNDPRVPLSESEQMVAAVRKNNVPVWYVVGKNEGHGFAKKANQDYLQAVEVEFLKKYLLAPADQQAEKVPARYPVRGMVRINGKPLASGVVVFTPVDPKGRKARGEVKDGRFRLTTIDANDGALPGQYNVTIEPSRDQHAPNAPAVPAQYRNPETTDLRAVVMPAANLFDFSIKAHEPTRKGNRR